MATPAAPVARQIQRQVKGDARRSVFEPACSASDYIIVNTFVRAQPKTYPGAGLDAQRGAAVLRRGRLAQVRVTERLAVDTQIRQLGLQRFLS